MNERGHENDHNALRSMYFEIPVKPAKAQIKKI